MRTLALRSRTNLTPVSELKRKGSGERLVNASGEFNASNTQDLLQAIAQLMAAQSRGEVAKESNDNKATVAERGQILEAAFRSIEAGNPRPWNELGAAVAGDLAESADREGFMRRLFVKSEVAQGSLVRVKVKTKNVNPIVASSPSELRPAFVRDKHYFPPEFYIKANIRVEEREIAQGAGDILGDKFFEAQEGIMVQEDRLWKKMADASIGLANNLQVLAGGLTPGNLSVLRTQITRWGLPAANMIIASDIWDDLIGSTAFGTWWDPVTKYELVQTGYIGTLLGMGVTTDAYREPQLKVLSAGDIYLTTTPEFHGTYTDRGPVQSREENSIGDGSPARGWSMWELMSMLMFNARSIVKGTRA